MGITLTLDYKPSFIKKKKKVLLHWRAQVNEEQAKLIREGIIEKFTDPPAFISSARWVEKNKQGRYCLVVDLRKQNEASVKLASVIPTLMEVWHNLAHDSEYFFTLDAHSSYYQAEIKPSSRKIFCFLLDDSVHVQSFSHGLHELRAFACADSQNNLQRH